MAVALITGVSRRQGIGFATARRLAAAGHDLFLHSWAPHDDERALGDPDGLEAMRAELGARTSVAHAALDFADPGAPGACLDAALAAYGRVDVLVANHARSSDQALGALTAAEIDLALAVNVRATLLLVQAYAAQPQAPQDGRVILMTSGQHRGPMPSELPYVAGKAALHGLTLSLAAALAPRGVTVNCVDPGPTDTGYASPEQHAAVARTIALGRWGEPDDAARLIAWLCSPDAGWITGQVVGSTGGEGLATP